MFDSTYKKFLSLTSINPIGEQATTGAVAWVHKCLLLILCFISSCSPPHQPNKHLRISFTAYPSTIDPSQASDFASSTLVCLIYEGLTRCLPEKGVEPALAETVEISPDQTIYTFHLRQAFWSDGRLITAYDFERSWKKIIEPASFCTFLFYPIKNVEKCTKGEVPLSEVGIKALDPQTLQVELEQPTPYFYSLTASPSFFPAPEEIGLAFSGPFILKEGKDCSEIQLLKNETFWNQDKIYLDEIDIRIIPDEMTAFQLFEQEKLDWLGGPLSPLSPDTVENLKPNITYLPIAATTLCTFNTETSPFNRQDVRKAFSYAINRKEIVEKVVQNGQIETRSILPPSLSSQSQDFFNPQLAKEHLARANIPLSELEKLTLYYRPGQVEKRLAQILQKQWESVFGIKIKLALLDHTSHAHRLQHRDYQLALTSWIAHFEDPMSILERFKDRNHLKNYAGWEDPLYIQMVNDRKLAQAEEIFFEQLPLTPIYHWFCPILYNSKIESIPSTPCGGILFERFRFYTPLAKNK